MAGDGDKVLDIKAADLKSTAPTFKEQSGKLHEALTALTHALHNLGKPWGEDDQGKRFQDAYEPAHTKIEGVTKVLVEGLASIHEAMVDMADGHIENDKHIAAMFTKKGVQATGGGLGSR
ncbi:hypothetical protein VR41_08050 [Streptomyces sp. NRRL B-1568]|nr:hypothetical protein VR41_08050 [Streptomyces sp. NRRL B-1568]